MELLDNFLLSMEVFSVGDEVNIYMVYLNDDINRRFNALIFLVETEKVNLAKLHLRMILLLLDMIGNIHFGSQELGFPTHLENDKNNGDYPS